MGGVISISSSMKSEKPWDVAQRCHNSAHGSTIVHSIWPKLRNPCFDFNIMQFNTTFHKKLKSRAFAVNTHTKMSTKIQSKEPISSAHEFNQATTIHCGQSSLHEQWPTWGRDVDLFISCSLDARPWRCLWQWSILQLRQQLCKGCLANKLFPAQVCQHGRKQGRKWYKIAEIYCNNKWIVYDVH